MRRRLTKLVIFLLLGAVLNVAVAWGCTRWPHTFSFGDEFTRDENDALWRAHGPSRWTKFLTGGMQRRSWHRFGRTSWALGSGFLGDPTPYAWSGMSGTSSSEYFWVLQAGWPLRCLRSRGRWSAMDLWYPRSSIQTAGLRSMPLWPIWPGFAVNTLFYAAILWLLPLGSCTARRMIRRKRGLCVACGYDLSHADHEACPECGAVCGPGAAAIG